MVAEPRDYVVRGTKVANEAWNATEGFQWQARLLISNWQTNWRRR
jgi:hypothetical protein